MRRRALIGLLTLAAALLLCAAPAGAARSLAPDDGPWTANGTVHALARAGQTVYLGGEFSWVGPQRGSLARTDAATGERKPAPRFSGGGVNVIEPDGAGGAFVGGAFTHVDGVERGPLVHLLASGSLDAAWQPGVRGEVKALARAGSVLYVGGRFDRIGARSRESLGAVDAATGEPTGFDPEAIGGSGQATVSALAVVGSRLYVAGDFIHVGGLLRAGLAALDTTRDGFNATTWNPAHDGAVSTLRAHGPVLYLGGSFTSLGGAARQGVAAVDTATDAVTPFDPGADGPVAGLSVAGDTLYVAGDFDRIAGADRSGVAAFDLGDHSLTGWDAGVGSGAVARVLVDGSAAYLAGAFTTVGGAPRRNLAAVDATSGALLPWRSDVDAAARALGKLGGDVLAGGAFRIVGGVPRANLAALDASSGEATAFDPAVGGAVRALAVGGTGLYLGGDFTSVGGAPRSRIAAVSAAGAVTGFDPGANATVRALAVEGPTLYAGGDFTAIAGQARGRLAALDAAGAATAWNPPTDAPVRALAADGGVIYAGGDFMTIAGQARGRLAAVDAAGAVTAWDPGADAPVGALAVGPGGVYAGGSFARVGGEDRWAIAELDRASGEATPWLGMTNGLPIAALALDGDTLLAGGFGLWGLSTADGSRGTWQPRTNLGVRAVLAVGPTAFAGGDGYTVPSMAHEHRHLAAYTTPPVPTVAPEVTGTWAAGAMLTCSTGTWANAPAAFATTWLRDGTIELGSGATHSLSAEDLAGAISCRVRATNAGGSATAESAPRSDPAAPRSVTPPSLAGEVAVGRTVGCDAGEWDNGPVTLAYRWLRDGSEIAGEQASAYVPAQGADAGHLLACRVTATNAVGSSTATSSAVALPAAPTAQAPPWLSVPAPALGADVTCHPGTWTGAAGSPQYAWFRDGAPIAGESAAVYRLRAADGGRELSCKVTAANAGGSTSAVSWGTTLAPVPEPTAAPHVKLAGGRAQCAGDAWSTGVARSYEWLRDGAPVPGEATDMRAIADADGGATLSCRVTASTAFASASATSPGVAIPRPATKPAPDPEPPTPAPAPTAPAPAAPASDRSAPAMAIPRAGWRATAERIVAPALACPPSERRCAGAVSVRVGAVTLGTARFDIAGGTAARPAIRVRTAKRRHLRARSVRAAVTLTVADPAGNHATARRTVVLRPRR
jgi:hypothetical protein